MNLKKYLPAFVSLTTMLGVVSCQEEKNTDPTTPAPTVSVTKVNRGDGNSTEVFSASIEGILNIDIRPQTSGYLAKILVDEGAFVKAGQPLFKIDDRPFLEQYKTAKAAALVAASTMKSLEIDLDRKKELLKNGIVSDLQVTEALNAFEGAKAGLEQANAVMNAAKINLDFCLVKAPASGLIGRIPYRLGSLVNPSSTEALTLLTDVSNVYSYFSMSETDFSKYHPQTQTTLDKDSVALILADGSRYPLKGVIDAITGQFDKNTGSILIRAKFPNPFNALRAGNTGRIEIKKELKNVFILPISATFSVQDKIYVYKVDKTNRTRQTEINVAGKTNDNYYINSGVQEGDLIITGGLGQIVPDMVVAPKI